MRLAYGVKFYLSVPIESALELGRVKMRARGLALWFVLGAFSGESFGAPVHQLLNRSLTLAQLAKIAEPSPLPIGEPYALVEGPLKEMKEQSFELQKLSEIHEELKAKELLASVAVPEAVPEALPEPPLVVKSKEPLEPSPIVVAVAPEPSEVNAPPPPLPEEAELAPELPLAELTQLPLSEPVVAAKPVEEPFHSVVRVSQDGAGIKVEPKRIEWDHPGQTSQLEFVGVPSSELSIFVRDEKLLSWQTKSQQLKALAAGESEVFIVSGDSMVILPVTIGTEKELAVPEELVALSDVLEPVEEPHQARAEKRRVASLKDSEANALRSLSQEQERQSQFRLAEKDREWQTVHLQIMDDRSEPALQRIFPAARVEVKIVGTEFSLTTDATGHVSFQDVPVGSRFLVHVVDQQGRYLPSTAEVYVSSADPDGVIPVRVVRENLFEAYAGVSGVVQDPRLGSLCGRATGVTASRVRLGAPADGPLYFSGLGPDPRLGELTETGRFCFFNIEQGIAELQWLDQNAQVVGAVSVPIIPGSHLEDTFRLDQGVEQTTRLAATPTAYEQLYNHGLSLGDYQLIDSANLLSVAEQELFESPDSGLLKTGPWTFYRGRHYGFLEGAEYESVLYSLQTEDHPDKITPLLPRGYVEDLHFALIQRDGEAAIHYDQRLGSLLIEYWQQGASDAPAQIKVLDAAGRIIDEVWYYGETTELTRGVVFNLDRGIYSVVVTDSTGQWLAAQTIAIDYETTSLISLGQTPIWAGAH